MLKISNISDGKTYPLYRTEYALFYFDGVPKVIVPDNLKSGVKRA